MDDTILAIDDLIGDDAELLACGGELLSASKSGTDEYNNSGNVSRDTFDQITQKGSKFVMSVLARVSLPVKVVNTLLNEIKTGITAVELLQATKKYCDGDGNADELIDKACSFIERISNHYPIIGPILGPVLGDATKIILNSAKDEGDALRNNSDLIGRFLDEYYLKTFNQDYDAYLLEQRILPEVSQGETTQLGGGVILVPNFQGVKTLSGTSNADNIENTFGNIKVYGLSGDDTITNKGDNKNVTINGGNGNDTIENQSSNCLLFAGEGNDSIVNNGGSKSLHVTIDGGAGSDFIFQKGDAYVSVVGGAGNDHIENYGYDNITLIGDAGNDYIHNWTFGTKTTLDGGAGNDYIDNKGGEVLLKGGSDSDTIVTGYHPSGGRNVTISGGTGNDLIDLEAYADNNLILYEPGDGNDIIYGFKKNSTLKIGNGSSTYSKENSGNDIVITVGNGKITLVGAKNLSAVSIQGTEVSIPRWKLNGTTATYSAASKTLLTLNGIGNTDDILVNDEHIINVPLTSIADGATEIVLTTDGRYKLKLGKGMTAPKTVKASYANNIYTTKGTSAGYTLSDDRKSIFYTATTTKKIEFSGVADSATASNFYVKNGTVTIGKAAVPTDGTEVKLLTEGYTLKLGKGMTASKISASLVDDVYTFGRKAGYILDGNSIVYTTASAPSLELSGVASKLTTPANEVVTLKLANFSDNLSVISNDGDYVFSIAGGTYTGKTFTGSSADDTITSAGKFLIINGGDGNDSIISTGKNVTLCGGEGNDTLWGGADNDTLYGGDGSDTFIYTPNGGTDRIYNFTSDDMLKILKADGSQGTFTNSSFKNGNLTLAVEGGGHVMFKDVSAGDTFNINDKTYTVRGSKLKR